MPKPCPHCGDTPGWRLMIVDGVRRIIRCECRTRNTPEQEAKNPAGFRPLKEIMERSPVVKAALTETDRRVAGLIEKCQGAQSAVTSAEIAASLWPGSSMDAREHERLRRMVTASVRNLRDLGRLPIAASKATPPGYFMPVTSEEFRDMHDRLFREGLKLIQLSQLYDRDKDLVRRLEGQLGFNTEPAEKTSEPSVVNA